VIGSNRVIRVVSFDGYSVLFRPKADEITSINYDIGPFDLKHDGQFEFIVDEPIASGPINVSVPRVKAWKANTGFTDVSGQHIAYYNDIVIPSFSKHIENASSATERQAYEQGLKSIRTVTDTSK
jgi:hypothetical protein